MEAADVGDGGQDEAAVRNRAARRIGPKDVGRSVGHCLGIGNERGLGTGSFGCCPAEH